MLKRKIDTKLADFFRPGEKKALLLTGARQTGKTFSIRAFGKSRFKNFIEVNFIESPEAVNLFANARDSSDILLRLSAFVQQPLIKGETLIFFDEVQECKEMVTAIKFLVDEGSYRYILSGSLLGVELSDIRSIPVGYLDIFDMYPLDFEEFIRALGITTGVINALRDNFISCKAVDKVIHDKMLELFRLYLIIGGMPAVVMRYLNSNNLQDVIGEQKAIIRLYEKDIAKYDKSNKLYIEEIFHLIPSELNSKNKRFILKSLNKYAKFSRLENGFIWLKEAGAAIPVYNVEEPKSPLRLARSRNLFKLFQSDVGMLAAQYANGIQLRLLSDTANINWGAIYENAVAQELYAHGFSLFYFNSKKQGELDFVIEKGGEVVPIEVKSGKDYHRHSALSNIMNNPLYGIKQAYVLCNDNLHVSGKIIYLPVYMMMFLQQENPKPLIHRVDVSSIIR